MRGNALTRLVAKWQFWTLGTLFIVILIALVRWPWHSLGSNPPETSSAIPLAPYELRLTADAEQRRDHVVLELTAKNAMQRPVRWDRKFSVFLNWRLIDIDKKENQVKNGFWANYYREAYTFFPELSQPRLETKDRFIAIPAGGVLKKTIELTEPFRCWDIEGVGSQPGGAHPSTYRGYEQVRRYVFGAEVKRIEISCGIGRNTQEDLGFKTLFGFRPETIYGSDLDIPCGSNQVIIRFSN